MKITYLVRIVTCFVPIVTGLVHRMLHFLRHIIGNDSALKRNNSIKCYLLCASSEPRQCCQSSLTAIVTGFVRMALVLSSPTEAKVTYLVH